MSSKLRVTTEVTVHEAIDVVVLGAINEDVALSVDRLPHEGETMHAAASALREGGKGLNQAIASARAGSPTALIGAIGDDEAGKRVTRMLQLSGVRDVTRLAVGMRTGQAFVTVDSLGANTIVLVSGANEVLCSLLEKERGVISGAKVLVLQLELDVSLALAAAEHAARSGVRVVLNAAPMRAVPDQLLDLVDILVVNESELEELPRVWQGGHGSLSALLARISTVIVTRGASGAVIHRRSQPEQHHAAYPARAVDTTGAGDAYCGVLAARLALGDSLDRAASFAMAAGSLAVRKEGAARSAPTAGQIEELLASGPGGWSHVASES